MCDCVREREVDQELEELTACRDLVGEQEWNGFIDLWGAYCSISDSAITLPMSDLEAHRFIHRFLSKLRGVLKAHADAADVRRARWILKEAKETHWMLFHRDK